VTLTRRRRWIFCTIALVALAACGIPVDARPRDIPGVETVTTLSGGTAQDFTARTIKLYYVSSATGRTDRLQPIQRRAEANPTAVVTELLKGLGAADDRALRSAIPGDTQLHAATLSPDGTAIVDLDQNFFKAKGDQLVRAVAQLVFSLSALEGVGQVRILVDGATREWPHGDGLGHSRALTVADFAELNPTSQPDYILAPSPPVGTTEK
jgi:spore germination protein GerM